MRPRRASHKDQPSWSGFDTVLGVPTSVTTKKRCCKSGPRCKKCPVVWKRLENEGLVVRQSKREWSPTDGKIPKRAMKAARAR